MPTVRTFTLRQAVIEADPEWVKKSKIVPEYEFTSERGEPRLFERDYTVSEIYSTDW